VKTSDLENQVHELNLENARLSTQVRTYEDHIVRLKTRIRALRQDLERAQTAFDVQRGELDETKRLAEHLSKKLRPRTDRLRQLSACVGEPDFAGPQVLAEMGELRQQITKLTRENEMVRGHNLKLNGELDELASQNETMTIKILGFERALRTGSIQSELVETRSELTNRSHDLAQLEERNRDLERKLVQSHRLIEELEVRTSKTSTRIEALTAENRDLKEETYLLKSQAAKSDRLQSEIEDLRRQIQTTEDKAQADTNRISELNRELERMKSDLAECTGLRGQRDALQDEMRLLQEKVKTLISSDDQNVQLSLRVEDLTARLTALSMQEKRHSDYITSLLRDRKELEVVRNELLRVEEDVHAREDTEMKLKSQIAHYRAKSHQLNHQVQVYEEELQDLRNQVFSLHSEILTTPGTPSRDGHRDKVVLKRKIKEERKRTRIAENEIAELQRRVARYQEVFDGR
jgi:chromosome segregation ATPase